MSQHHIAGSLGSIRWALEVASDGDEIVVYDENMTGHVRSRFERAGIRVEIFTPQDLLDRDTKGMEGSM